MARTMKQKYSREKSDRGKETHINESIKMPEVTVERNIESTKNSFQREKTETYNHHPPPGPIQATGNLDVDDHITTKY